MPLQELAVPHRVTGLKEVGRALELAEVAKLFVAEDADRTLVTPLVDEAERQGVPVESAPSRVLLGRACCLDVKAAVAALLEERGGAAQ
ncbi:MAG: ribosomal L7Ae/L30e/S12e/Gadd45 family protein [Synergistales bacterium]|nr:ribosomal L7Ae/L30e/S12e/Gadd45 family protein [Synergistales bacterium]